MTSVRKTVVLYHAGCFDGFCAAWAIRQALGEVLFFPVNHGEPVPEFPTGSNVYIVDFCYPAPTLLEIAIVSRHMTVIDHHKTAKRTLDEFEEVVKQVNAEIEYTIVFDTTKSGGRLTWEHFFGQDREIPWLVRYTEDRDLWAWQLNDSHAINAFLRSHPMDMKLWGSMSHIKPGSDAWLDIIKEGNAIIRRDQYVVESHVRRARELQIAGHKVLVVNATTMISEIAGELAIGRPFGACYFDRGHGVRQWSLRSDKNGLDVSEIAQLLGGGGHKHAAGFETHDGPL